MDNVVPILTGERERRTATVALDAYNLVLDKYDDTCIELKLTERELKTARAELKALKDAIKSGKFLRPGAVWRRIAFAVLCTALLMWPIARMVG